MSHLRRLCSITAIPLLMLPVLTGCWDRVETNDVAFVLASSVDLEDDGRYRIAYILPLPGSMGGASGGGGGTSGGKSYYVDSEVGTTMREAVGKLQNRLSRKIFLSHRRTVLIGEKLAKRGIGPIFDVVPRSPETRLTCFLIVTKGKAYEMFNTTPKFERFPAEAIRELTKSRQSMPTSTKDIGMTLSFGSDPIVSYLKETKNQASNDPHEEVEVVGYAQFKGDRMIGIYKDDEAHGLMWLENNVKEHGLTFPIESGKDITIMLTKGHVDITPILQGDHVIFNLKLEAYGQVREDLAKTDLGKPENLHKVERKFAEQVKKNVQAAVKQMQKEGTDSAQLGLLIWRRYPNIWNTKLQAGWQDVFKNAEFRITVQGTITETGLINQNVVEEKK